MNRQVRELRQLVAGMGLKMIRIIPTRGGHLSCYIEHPDGRTLTYTTGNSPGDHRRIKNMERDIARYFRQGEIR